jgi:benzoate-CoA ligase
LCAVPQTDTFRVSSMGRSTVSHNASLLVDRNLEAGRGHKTAVIAPDRTVTYAELAADVSRWASFLRSAGIGREDRVLLVLDDTTAFPVAFLGTIRIGAVPIPVNPLDRSDNYAYYLEDSYAKAVVVDAALRPKLEEALAGRDDLLVVVANGDASGAVAFADALSGQSGELAAAPTHRDDMAFWLYSSGSTGRPKGVVHLQHDIERTCETYARHVLQITDADVCFSTTKLFHAYGLGNGLSFPMWAGATSVLMAGRPTPEPIFSTVEAHRPSLFFSVPALYAAMLKAGARERDFSSVRACVSAAEALAAAVQARWREATGKPILDGVGSTEMLHIYCSNTLDHLVPGASGQPVPGYELKIVDEQGREVPPGEPGDLLVRGDSCAAFYWHQHEKTMQCMRGDWFYSGDRYVQTAEGDFVYQGRADDMIKVGGLWVAPADVEACLVEHPRVSEAAVIGVVVDDVSRIKAFVIPTEPPADADALAEELRSLCKARLRRYEYPHVVEFVGDFPRTATGKIQRFRLRDSERERQPA